MDPPIIPGAGWTSGGGSRRESRARAFCRQVPGDIGNFQDMDRTSKVVSPDDNRLSTSMRILDVQQIFTEHVMPKQVAWQVRVPVLHPVPMKSTTALTGEHAGHRRQAPPKEQENKAGRLRHRMPEEKVSSLDAMGQRELSD